MFDELQGLIPEPHPVTFRPRLSMTADILAARRCMRQYGYFRHERFVPSRTTQIYFGTIVHQVLDMAHRFYEETNQMPGDHEIEEFFNEVHDALVARGIRPRSRASQDNALEVIRRFNQLEGPNLYPLVIDTECHLETNRDDYILEGVVDVLRHDEEGNVEIWDYKGMRRPPDGNPILNDYIWQMRVYAELYCQKTGAYPTRAVLYFVNELLEDEHFQQGQRPPQALYVIEFQPEIVQAALAEFDGTAHTIIDRLQTREWPEPEQPPPQETCDACDLRWNCMVAQHHYNYHIPHNILNIDQEE